MFGALQCKLLPKPGAKSPKRSSTAAACKAKPFTRAGRFLRPSSRPNTAIMVKVEEHSDAYIVQGYPNKDELGHVTSKEQYLAMYERSVKDPVGFWGDIAREFTWSKQGPREAVARGAGCRWRRQMMPSGSGAPGTGPGPQRERGVNEGPFGWPFVGNMPSILKYQLHIYQHRMHQKYGPIFKIWVGSTPWVIVCDADNMRKGSYKINTRLGIPSTLLGEERFMLENMMVLTKGQTWQLLKKAWDPALLHRASLEGYAPLMQECSEGLLQRLEGVAQQGEVLDVCVELQRMSLDVAGSCAFGIKFYDRDAADSTMKAWGGDSEELRQWCKQFFRSTMMNDHSSQWHLPALMLSQLDEPVRWLAHLMPDKGHKWAVESMQGMASTAKKIIGLSSAQRLQSNPTSARVDTAAAIDQQESSATATEAAKRPAVAAAKLQGVLPGSFVAQLEAWRAKYDPTASSLTDNLIAAQVITFLLAGYETTANALGFLVYRLSIHPEAQQKLQAELDTVLGGRKPAMDDLPKLPYLDACIKEAMRLHPPFPVLTREYDDDEVHPHSLELCGKAIPRGGAVVMSVYVAGVSPDYWERPEEFLPERFLPETGGSLGPFNDNAYLPFGAGGRKCTGYKFAEQEMMLVVAGLLQKFSVTRPAGLGPLRTTLGVTLAPKDGVKVLLKQRK